MQICLLYKNTKKYIIVVVASSMFLFLIKLNFRTQIVIFLLRIKLLPKHKESPLGVASFFVQ